MDPSRKRAIRLTVALTAALLLATALIYVSFNAGRDELTASQLLTRARAGQTYILAGTVLPGFERTGGLHATGLFNAGGELLFSREDVGRHNAMDKVIGRALLDGLVPLSNSVLCVSGRLSFELVQKAAVAGAPILVGVGAPSSLAVSLADDRNMTLCGFARGGRVNVYTHPERVRS